jgi:hypothetical protein
VVLDRVAEWTGAPEFVDRVPVQCATYDPACAELVGVGEVFRPGPNRRERLQRAVNVSCYHLRPPSPSQRLALALMHCPEIQALLEDVRAEHGIEPVAQFTVREKIDWSEAIDDAVTRRGPHHIFYGLDTTPQIG